MWARAGVGGEGLREVLWAEVGVFGLSRAEDVPLAAEVPLCVECGLAGFLEPFNINGHIGVPVCLACRRTWFEAAKMVEGPGR